MIQLERRNKEKSIQVKQIIDNIKQHLPDTTKENFMDNFNKIISDFSQNSEKMKILTVAKNNMETKNIQLKQRIDQLN